MQYQLVLQFAAGPAADYDALVAIEHQLIAALGEDAVDGHDMGRGESEENPLSRLIRKRLFVRSHRCWKPLDTCRQSQQRIAASTKIDITFYGQRIPRGSSVLHSRRGSNQTLQPTAQTALFFSCPA